MTTTGIDFAKYEGLNRRKLLFHLDREEQRLKKINEDFKQKISSTNQLIEFLRTKLKNAIDPKEEKTIPLEKFDVYERHQEKKKNMSEEEKQALTDKVEKLIEEGIEKDRLESKQNVSN